MLKTTAICKQRAAQCARRAILTTDETLRALYRDLAEQWQNMANDADRLDRLTIKPS
jgi:vacuolar-type H+-ATPase catalytic subunit A/Vma1